MCLQLIKQFQAQLPTVAIIIMGSATSRPNAVTALNAGAADFMRKPVDEDELVARIERHVQRQVSCPCVGTAYCGLHVLGRCL